MLFRFANNRSILSLVISVFLICVESSAQRTLKGQSYIETFDASRDKLPVGWTIYKNAKETSQGSSGIKTLSLGRWGMTSSGVYSCISGNSPTETGDDYAVAILSSSTSGTGDPGAGFQVELKNEEPYHNYQLSFRLQSLNVSRGTERSITWEVQYQKSGQAWKKLPTGSSDMNTVLSTTQKNSLITVDMGTELDNFVGVFLLRIVAYKASTGEGSRPLSAIDDFTLTYESNKQPQSITFDPLPIKPLSESSFELSAIASSGLSISYSSSNIEVATVSGSTVHLKSAGETLITASQTGNTSIAPAADVVQRLQVVRPTVSGMPTSIAFGSQLIAQLHTQTFVLRSQYLESDLTLAVEGESFSVDPTLLPLSFDSREHEIRVSFSPSTNGVYPGFLILQSTDVNYKIPLSGRAFSAEPPVVTNEEITNSSFSFSWNPIAQAEQYQVAIDQIIEIPQENNQSLCSASYNSFIDWTLDCYTHAPTKSWVLNNANQHIASPEIDFSPFTNIKVVIRAAIEGGNYIGNRIDVFFNGKQVGSAKPTQEEFVDFVVPVSVVEKGALSFRTPLTDGGVGAKIQSITIIGDRLPYSYPVAFEGSPFLTHSTSFSLDNLPEKSKYRYEVSAIQGKDVATSTAREVEIKQDVKLVVDAPTVVLDETIRNTHRLMVPANSGNEAKQLRLTQGNQSVDYLTFQSIPGKAANELKVESGASLSVAKGTCVEMNFSSLKGQWVFLSLPFDLNIVHGIKVVNQETEYVGRCEVDYALRVYDSERRSQGYSSDNWWNVNQSGDPSYGQHTRLPGNTDILPRGHGFIFYVPTETPHLYRFYAHENFTLTDQTTIQGVGYWQSGREENGGWQLLGNPTLTGENQKEAFPRYVYRHNALIDSYIVDETIAARLAPLQSYFVQLPQGEHQLSFSSLSASKETNTIVRRLEQRIVLSLFRNDQKWSEASIVFDDFASEQYVYNEDALIFDDGNPSRIGTLSGKFQLAINRTPFPQNDIPFFCLIAPEETASFRVKRLVPSDSIESVFLFDAAGKQLADLLQVDYPVSPGKTDYFLRIVPRISAIATPECADLRFFFVEGRLSTNQDLSGDLTLYHLNGLPIACGSLAHLSSFVFPKGAYLLRYQQKSYRLIH